MDKKLKEDLKDINIPFDLLSAFQSVVTEFGKQKFKYDSINDKGEQVLRFKKTKQRILMAIEKEHLFIRQFDIKGKQRKLRVLYVVKPSERKF